MAAEETPDRSFKLYFEAVNAASQRTRATAYVLLATVLIIFTAYRTTADPGWMELRLTRLQLASACLAEQSTNAPSNTPNPDCPKALDYAKGFLVLAEGSYSQYGYEFKKELQEHMNAVIKERTEALSLRLPFFGMVIDTNDLGLIGGIFLASILYALYAGVDREVDNLERAKRKAKSTGDSNQQREDLELLLMTQVLSSRRGTTFGIHLLLVAVVAVYFYLVKSDVFTYHVRVNLQGTWWARLETVTEVLLFLLVVFFCVQCFRKIRALDRSIDELIDASA